MRERPILFSAPMVRAILDGRKTQTRRTIKGVPSWDHYGRDIMDWGLSGIHQETYDPNNPIERTDRWHLDVQTEVDDHSRRVIRCPYGAPGDRLWVRETWSFIGEQGIFELYQASPSTCKPIYRADEAEADRWWPSIHMPRWASRLTLAVTEIRAERLHDISFEDCWAEGVICHIHGSRKHTCCSGLKDGYRALWDQINGPGSWDANPWVWVVTFESVDAGTLPPDEPNPLPTSDEGAGKP